MTKTKAIIIDLDGTLCDVEHRVHFLSEEPKNWKGFYGAMTFDKPLEWCLELIKNFAPTHTILFVTGRPDNYKVQTAAWLKKHLPAHVHWKLFMRKEGDYSVDTEVKYDIYWSKIALDYQVIFAVDDREEVMNMWAKCGFPAHYASEVAVEATKQYLPK